MTGYGRGEGVLHDRAITVEVRAVNNRYLDCAVKMPRALCISPRMRIKSPACRSRWAGERWMCSISIDATGADEVAVSREPSLWPTGITTALTQMRDAYDLKDDISVSRSCCPVPGCVYRWTKAAGGCRC